MNRQEIAGRWTHLRGRMRTRWGRLTGNEIAVLMGRRDQLLGLIQKRYGIARERAHKAVRRWTNRRGANRHH
jgi:uncharacterized protein YjbJ (UPF0337 family)